MSIFDPPFNPSAAILDNATSYGRLTEAVQARGGIKRDSGETKWTKPEELIALLKANDPDATTIVTAGTGTKKAERELARIRAQLRAREEIVGEQPRLVSDEKPSGFPASRYGTEKAINTTLMDNDFNDAYLEARKLGVSDRDARMLAQMKIGQRATEDISGQEYTYTTARSGENRTRGGRTAPQERVAPEGMRTAINEAEMSDLRRALTKEAAESLDPLVGPYLPTPVEKKITQQVESTPPAIYSKDRRRMAGRLAELLIPLITGASGSYLLIDALDGPDKARADAELLAQLTR